MTRITIKKLSIVSMIFLSTFLFSCKEEPPVRSGDGIRITNSTTFSNPYDSVGIVHNLILNQMIVHFDSLYLVCDSSEFVEKFYKVLTIASCEVGYSLPSSNCINYLEPQLISMRNSLQSFEDLEDLFDFRNTSQDCRDLYYELMQIFDESESLNELKDNIVDLEIKIDTTSTISSFEKEVLLSASSVARHSSTYWHSVDNNPHSPWNFDNGCEESGFKTMKQVVLLDAKDKWLKVGATDVGALVGYSVKTIWAGPWGIGAALGATAGASAASAIVEFRDEIWGGIRSACNWIKGLF